MQTQPNPATTPKTPKWCRQASGKPALTRISLYIRQQYIMDQVEISPNPASSRRGAMPIVLPLDAKAATACVLSFVTTSNLSFDRSSAIEAMSNRIALLRDGSGDSQENELAGHLTILDALWLRYASEAARADKPENSAIWTKLALLCQSSYMRTALAIESLRAQRQQRPMGVLQSD
jgi:hypothetical protein